MTEQQLQRQLVNWMKEHLLDAELDKSNELINLYGIGEVHTTRLAEGCAYDSGLIDNPDDVLDDDTHIIWDAAIIAGEWFEGAQR